jgi:ABC-type siderophore export system fused ATPase/permease subunit
MVRLIAILLLGGIVLWVRSEYGWESPRTIWAAVMAVLLLMAGNLAEMQTRIARLEEQIKNRE